MPDRRGVPVMLAAICASDRPRLASVCPGVVRKSAPVGEFSAPTRHTLPQNGIGLESGSGKALFERFCKASMRSRVHRMAALTLGKYRKVINGDKWGTEHEEIG